MYHTTISVIDAKSLAPLFGTRDRHLRQICDTFGVNISTRDDQIHVEGEKGDVALATEVLERLTAEVNRHGSVAPEEVSRVLATVQGGTSLAEAQTIDVLKSAQPIRPRTSGQERYVQAIRENDLVFAIGPAGTGKTYLAVAMAVEALKQNLIRKIVLVRPAVEAGESLGFLPGDLQAKINPFLRPLLDALRDMMEYDQIKLHMEQDLIEVIPLAYMRGRTLNEAFIILDEAQNTTVGQMKMLLTRLGMGSKVVVSGDVTQMDLPSHTKSGLVDGLTRLKSIDGFASVTLTNSDIVRHRLVREILRAYEEGTRKRR